MIELINCVIRMHGELPKKSGVPDFATYAPIYNREYKTIHLNIGRQSGKTYSMMQLARRGDLIIVHNEDTRRRLIQNYPNCLAEIITTGGIGRTYGYATFAYRTQHSFDRVWVDEPSLHNVRELHLVWELTSKLFILLGA